MRLGKVRHESKYLAIEYFHTEKNWSIGWMCKHLEVARAAYYKWLHRETPEDEMENIKLAELIKEYDERFSHILGYRRMTSWINHFNQTKYSKNRVHRIMKKLGIHSVIRKKKKKYRNANADETTQNILQRDFYATAPNQKWATDVTEFKVPGKKKKLYLSEEERNAMWNSARNADMAYVPDVTYTVTLDGFIVSDNIECLTYENVDTGYSYSDHDPVYMEFKLK